VSLKERKEAFDGALVLLQKKYDKHLGVIDLMTQMGELGSRVDHVAAKLATKDAKPALSGALSPFNTNAELTAELVKEYFKELAEAMEDRPATVWGQNKIEDLLSSAFTHYTECDSTAKAVLIQLLGAQVGKQAHQGVSANGGAASGQLDGVPYKRGVLSAQDVARFPVPSKDAVVVMETAGYGEHIFVLALVGGKWRLYQSFHRKYLISRPGFGNTAVDDFKKFLTGITSDDALEWFGAPMAIRSFKYLVVG
jgi:hypothetical protein